MLVRNFLLYILYGILCLVLIVGGMRWLNHEVELVALTVTAAHDAPEIQGLPVFAQFVVTQTISLPEVTKISQIVIPIQRPEVLAEPLVIDLLRYGQLQQRWRYADTTGREARQVIFALDPPLLLEGDLALVFSARGVSHENQNKAPRIFAESAGTYYPGGSYRIAENEKSGDIGFSLRERKTRLTLLQEDWRQKPVVALAKLGRWFVVTLMLLAIPAGITRVASLMAGHVTASKPQNEQRPQGR